MSRLHASRKPTLWVYIFAAISATVIASLLTPGVSREIVENRMLEYDPKEVTGVVVGLTPQSGRNQCSSVAIVEYRVNTRTHSVAAQGCGAAQGGRIKIGDQARVVYLGDDPVVSRAYLPGAVTPRWNWYGLMGMWLVTTALCGYAFFLLRTRRGGKPSVEV